MSHRRRGTRILGLSLLATLGLMTAGVAGAQAGEFLIEENGVKKTFVQHNNLASETFAGSLGENELLVEGGVKIFCNNGEPSGTFFQGGKADTAILFGGCKVLETKQCIVYETELADKMKTPDGYYYIDGTGEIFLFNNTHYIWVEDESLGVIWFGDNGFEECPLPLSVAVSGSFALKVPNVLTPEIFQGFETITAAEEAALQTPFPELGLYFGEEEARYKAGSTGSIYLAGGSGLNGKKWGAH